MAEISDLRCPECGAGVFKSSLPYPNDWVVCRDMGHWAGPMSECKVASEPTMNITYRRFLPQAEYVESFVSRAKIVPPFIGWVPYVVRNGVEGYMVPCKEDHPDAEKWPADSKDWPDDINDWYPEQ